MIQSWIERPTLEQVAEKRHHYYTRDTQAWDGGSSGASTKSDERAVLWGFKREKDPAGGENWEIIQEQGVLENRE